MSQNKGVVRFLGIILACLIIVSMFGALPSTTYAANFGIGDTVEVYNTGGSGLLVRDDHCGNVIGGKFDGDRGVVLDGPVYCNNYNRWLIRWSDGLEGWSAENWLRKVTTSTVPEAFTLSGEALCDGTNPYNHLSWSSSSLFGSVRLITIYQTTSIHSTSAISARAFSY